MHLEAEQRIAAPRDHVFAALNDPEILRQCIPGCESLDKSSETDMSAVVALKIGPVKARFKGKVELSDIIAPESYKITGEGAGGAAGFAKGGAAVSLIEDGDGTILRYKVDASVGGRLAQLGSRLIDSTAKTLSGKFFTTFREVVEAQASSNSEDEGVRAPSAETTASPETQVGQAALAVESVDRPRKAIWIGLGAVVVATAAYLLTTQ